jgi:hypothetical protein
LDVGQGRSSEHAFNVSAKYGRGPTPATNAAHRLDTRLTNWTDEKIHGDTRIAVVTSCRHANGLTDLSSQKKGDPLNESFVLEFGLRRYSELETRTDSDYIALVEF